MRFTVNIKTKEGETFADALKRTVNADRVEVAVMNVAFSRKDGDFAADLPKLYWPEIIGGKGLALPAEIRLQFDTDFDGGLRD